MQRKLRNHCAEAAGDFFSECEIFLGKKLRQARTYHCDGAAIRGHGGLVGGGVDSTRQPGDDGEASLCDLVGKFLGSLRAVNRRPSRADHTDGMFVSCF